MLDEDSAWNASVNRDAAQDGHFFYGVVTTGVFCRPSCTSKLPLRPNVRFYPNAAEAQRAGLRACLRCRPTAPAHPDANAARVRAAAEFIQQNCDQDLRRALSSVKARQAMPPTDAPKPGARPPAPRGF